MLTSKRLKEAGKRLILLNPLYSWWIVLRLFFCIKGRTVGDRIQEIPNETLSKKTSLYQILCSSLLLLVFTQKILYKTIHTIHFNADRPHARVPKT